MINCDFIAERKSYHYVVKVGGITTKCSFVL